MIKLLLTVAVGYLLTKVIDSIERQVEMAEVDWEYATLCEEYK